MITHNNTLYHSLMHTLDYICSGYWLKYGDSRFQGTILMRGGPMQVLAVSLSYLAAVTVVGPRLMRRRQPMDNLIWPIRLYNAFMVAFNLYLFITFSRKLNWGLDCWGCGKSMQKVDQHGIYLWQLFLLSRYFDFLDSLFFVCRKKFNHLSVLHVSHHFLVPILVWIIGKVEPTPMLAFAGYVNVPIHVIMYSYYFLSTFPELRPYLWWKKYITSIQIIQFALDFAHSMQVFYFVDCKYHMFTYIETAFSLTFIYLFGQFYLKSYVIQDKKREDQINKHSKARSVRKSSRSRPTVDDIEEGHKKTA